MKSGPRSRARTPLGRAAARAVLVFLTVPLGLGAAPADENSRLLDAVKRGDRQTVLSLLQRAPGPRLANAADADGTTVLHWAVHRDEPEIVEGLLSAGASVRAANRFGVQPLSLAAADGNAALVARLLRAGADPQTAVNGESALMLAPELFTLTTYTYGVPLPPVAANETVPVG